LVVGGGELVPFRRTPVNMEAIPPMPEPTGDCVVGDEEANAELPCVVKGVTPPGLLNAPLASSCKVGIFGIGGGDAALGIPNGFLLPVWCETTGLRVSSDCDKIGVDCGLWIDGAMLAFVRVLGPNGKVGFEAD